MEVNKRRKHNLSKVQFDLKATDVRTLATRARRTRQSRARQGLNSGITPAATAAEVPAITPAAGTAAAMDGGVELATGEGDPGTLQDTGVVREAIRVLSRVGKGTGD